MKKTKPALVTRTKPDYDATTDLDVSAKRSVTYSFKINSTDGLQLPYAVSVAGTVRPEFAKKPKLLDCDNSTIVVRNVHPGSKVSLYLNSDAHPSYQDHAVYEVVVGDHDVIVEVEEKPGKHQESDRPVLSKGGGSSADSSDDAERYTAPLTGDIWMKVSHKYTATQAIELLPSGTADVVKAAVKKIYDGLTTTVLDITAQEGGQDKAGRSIKVTLVDSANASENISVGYDFLLEGALRVHPAGYAAMFTAALDAEVSNLTINSGWRPMFGKLPHRAGLGLDVNILGKTKLNRQELRDAQAVHTSNVSQEEKTLFSALESAKREEKAAAKPGASATAAQVELAKKKRIDAETAWSAERDRNEPEHVRLFRSSLNKNQCVSQIFDPWFMDKNTHDKIPASSNLQVDANERLHSHHLHITVYEPNIL